MGLHNTSYNRTSAWYSVCVRSMTNMILKENVGSIINALKSHCSEMMDRRSLMHIEKPSSFIIGHKWMLEDSVYMVS